MSPQNQYTQYTQVVEVLSGGMWTVEDTACTLPIIPLFGRKFCSIFDHRVYFDPSNYLI